jgi:hypothetical protein
VTKFIFLVSRSVANRLYKPIEELAATQSRFILFLYSLIFLEMLILLIVYFWWAYKYLTYPYQVDYGEGFLLYYVQSLNQGNPVYHDISKFPFIPVVYPPVFPVICAALSKIFGLKFMIGRSLSFASALLSCLFIYLIVVRSARKYIAIISSILFLSSPYIVVWSLLYRVDTMAFLFSLVGMYIVLKFEDSRFIFLSIVFFLLSVFTKQSFVSAPLAAFIYLLTKNSRTAVQFFALFVVSGILIFAILNDITHGQFYIHTVTHQSHIDFSLRRTFLMFKEFFLFHEFLLTFAFSYALYALSSKKSSLFVFYFVIALITSIAAGKTGSGINYFIELIATSCVLFGFFVEEINQKLSRSQIPQIFIATVLAIQFIPNPHFFRTYTYTQDLKYGEKISNYVKQSSGRILTEDAGFAVLNGRVPITQPFDVTQLSKNGLWDQSVLLNALRDKSISLSILTINLTNIQYDDIKDTLSFTKEVIRELKKNYKLVDHLGRFYIYKPSIKMSNKN